MDRHNLNCWPVSVLRFTSKHVDARFVGNKALRAS
jgi:hypothetical protein